MATVNLALLFPLPNTEESKNKDSPFEYPEPEETIFTDVIEFELPDTTTLAVAPFQLLGIKDSI